MSQAIQKSTFIKQDSLSVVEFGEKILSSSLISSESHVKIIRDQISELDLKARIAYKDLSRYIDSIYQIVTVASASIPGIKGEMPDTLSNALSMFKPEEYQIRVNSDPTYQLCRQVALSYSKHVEDEITKRESNITKILSKKKMLTDKLYYLDRYHGEEVDKRQKDARYDTYKTQIIRVTQLQKETYELSDLFDDFPEEFTTQDAINRFNNSINVYCVMYKARLSRLTQDMEDFSTDYPEYTALLSGCISRLKDTSLYPNQYPSAVDNRYDILVDCGQFIPDALNQIKSNITDNLNALSGGTGIPNKKVRELIEKTKAIVTSEVRVNNADQSTLDQLKQKNTDVLQKSVDTVNEGRKWIEAGIDKITEFVISALGNKFENMLTGFVLTKGFMKKKTPIDADAKNKKIREVVRQEYGGDLPFCDEVEATNDNSGNYGWEKEIDCVFDPATETWVLATIDIGKQIIEKIRKENVNNTN